MSDVAQDHLARMTESEGDDALLVGSRLDVVAAIVNRAVGRRCCRSVDFLDGNCPRAASVRDLPSCQCSSGGRLHSPLAAHTRGVRSALALGAALALSCAALTSCASDDPALCETLARNQAEIEEIWTNALAEHAHLDAAVTDQADTESPAMHDEEHARLVDARAAVIVATAKASAACG